jgi:chemotaxis protein MotB
MATEGYGQYAPFSDNSDELSRQQNRKVVIAISKYALPQEKIKKTNNQQQKQQKTQVKRDNTIKVIELENGGILITTREQQ